MQGELRGDFTRDTFNPKKHFLRVLIKQGQVQLDAEPNEQSSILIHYLQSLAVDLMGPHAAPAEDGGFEILTKDKIQSLLDNDLKKTLLGVINTDDFIVGKGKYYVNGILCENDHYISLFEQPSPPFPIPESRENIIEKSTNYLIYLDVWERHINYIQDEIFSGKNIQDSSIREVALGGADTATRSQIVWQAKFKKLTDKDLTVATPTTPEEYSKTIKNEYQKFLDALGESREYPGRGTGKLKARAKSFDSSNTDPCIVKPTSSYRGNENQLYRVEIHNKGKGKKEGQNNQENATFKWSRENSSVVFPILKLATSSGTTPKVTITLAHLGQDNRFTLEQGDWVEIVDDDYIFQNLAKPLLKVDSIDRDEQTVSLTGIIDNGLGQNPKKHPFVRRWDRDKNTSEVGNDNGVKYVEENKWLLLEDGVEIYFPSAEDPTLSFSYRTGDYWLIPARTATGDVEWPKLDGNPVALPPHGIVHYYAPLAVISVDNDRKITSSDCRRKLKKQWEEVENKP
jgi:Family of unknown function (DUF6519)